MRRQRKQICNDRWMQTSLQEMRNLWENKAQNSSSSDCNKLKLYLFVLEKKDCVIESFDWITSRLRNINALYLMKDCSALFLSSQRKSFKQTSISSLDFVTTIQTQSVSNN
jgi:hypothetical protein